VVIAILTEGFLVSLVMAFNVFLLQHIHVYWWISGSDELCVQVYWRLKLLQVLKGHDDHVITCLEFCGNKIVSGSDDNTLKVWSAVNGKVASFVLLFSCLLLAVFRLPFVGVCDAHRYTHNISMTTFQVNFGLVLCTLQFILDDDCHKVIVWADTVTVTSQRIAHWMSCHPFLYTGRLTQEEMSLSYHCALMPWVLLSTQLLDAY